MIDLKIPGLRAVREIEREHQLTVLAEVEAHQPPVQCCLLGPAETVRNGTKRVMYRDRPNLGKFVDIHIDRQRFKCKHCGKTLYETIPGVNDKHRMTERLYNHLRTEPDRRTFTAIAAEVGVTEGTVRNVFNAYVGGINRALDDIQRAGRGYSFEVMRAKALLAHGHHKRDLPKFVRERFDNKHVSMSPEGWASLPRVNFGVDFESLRRAVCTTNTVARWDGSRYVETVLPSGLSTLKVPELEAA